MREIVHIQGGQCGNQIGMSRLAFVLVLKDSDSLSLLAHAPARPPLPFPPSQTHRRQVLGGASAASEAARARAQGPPRAGAGGRERGREERGAPVSRQLFCPCAHARAQASPSNSRPVAAGQRSAKPIRGRRRPAQGPRARLSASARASFPSAEKFSPTAPLTVRGARPPPPLTPPLLLPRPQKQPPRSSATSTASTPPAPTPATRTCSSSASTSTSTRRREVRCCFVDN
jgi:hypothetical protein